jgi:hypothetical protein
MDQNTPNVWARRHALSRFLDEVEVDSPAWAAQGALGASHAEDILELRLLTAGAKGGPADLSRTGHPDDQ